jgi:hypothetical protein
MEFFEISHLFNVIVLKLSLVCSLYALNETLGPINVQ